MNILLVSPLNEDDVHDAAITKASYLSEGGPGAPVPPLGLLTIAGVTPPRHSVVVYDENLHGPVESFLSSRQFDIIGISIYVSQLKRALRIFRFCKERHVPGLRVLGGVGATCNAIDDYPYVDVVFLGEATVTWPRFLEDFERHAHAPVYERLERPDPLPPVLPRWELIQNDLPRYAMGSVQTTEGCPNDCDFCAVTNLHGRIPRHKAISQVLLEIRVLESLGVKRIFIADDNFIGDAAYAKALLRELVSLNNAFKVPIQFMTQADMSMAADREMLELMADSNFVAVIVGVESPRIEALRDLNKTQNLQHGVRRSIREIQRHGIIVYGMMLLGSDTDDARCFDESARFVQEVNLAALGATLLWARVGTRTWYRMKALERVVELSDEEDPTEESLPDLIRSFTNLVPNRMSRVEVLEGYAAFLERVFEPKAFQERAEGLIRGVTRKPRVKTAPLPVLKENYRVLFGMLRYYLTEADPEERKMFFSILHTAMRHAPYMVPKALFLCVQHQVHSQKARQLAAWARARASLEREQAVATRPTDSWVPIPQSIRANDAAIVHFVHDVVADRVGEGERLYQTIVGILDDYVAKAGDRFEQFDARAQEVLLACCNRALDAQGLTRGGGASPRSSRRYPPGLVRQMMDDLDRRLRRKAGRPVEGGMLPRWI